MTSRTNCFVHGRKEKKEDIFRSFDFTFGRFATGGKTNETVHLLSSLLEGEGIHPT
jgi:hypothetical protein